MILLPFYGLLPVCPARPLTSDINEAFSSTQLLLTGHFLFLEPLPVKPRDGCDDVNIPVYLQLVKCSDCQWSTSITMFTTFKITFVPFRHPPPLLELLLLQVVLTTSTCLNSLRCCRVVMFVCFLLTLDSSRGKEGNAPVNHNLYCQHRTVHRANCDSRAMTAVLATVHQWRIEWCFHTALIKVSRIRHKVWEMEKRCSLPAHYAFRSEVMIRRVGEVSAEQMVIKLALELSSFAESANQNSFTVFCVDKGSLIPQEHCSNCMV